MFACIYCPTSCILLIPLTLLGYDSIAQEAEGQISMGDNCEIVKPPALSQTGLLIYIKSSLFFISPPSTKRGEEPEFPDRSVPL